MFLISIYISNKLHHININKPTICKGEKIAATFSSLPVGESMKALVLHNSCNSRLKLGLHAHVLNNVPSTSNTNNICFLPPPNSNAGIRILCKSITKAEVATKEGRHWTIQMDEEAEPKESGKEKMFSIKEEEEEESISKIPVPRQRYIPISKPDLLNALLRLFNNEKDAQDFLTISKCLESILHAEHKSVLEEMRHDYTLTHADMKKTNQDFEDHVHGSSANLVNGQYHCNQENIIESLFNREQTHEWHLNEMSQQIKSNTSIRCDLQIPNGDMRVIFATRFQRNFLQLLQNAEFQELSTQDLQLTSALNSDYLLTLPIDVDWERASSSNAIIFKRGYTAERQDGLLIGEKIDYLQSRLLQKMFSSMSLPLLNIGMWINEKWKILGEKEQAKSWTEGLKHWLKEPLLRKREYHSGIPYQHGNLSQENYMSNVEAESELPIWFAAQQAIPRYESFLSSAGARGRLLRKLLVWMGILPSEPPATIMVDNESSSSDPYLRPKFLSRVSLKDIWKPATREICGNNVWRQIQAAFSVLFSRSTLQEPAFKELVLLYTAVMDKKGNEQSYDFPTLQLEIYKRIPIPDLKVIFPNKKLFFRILDTVRLDIATMLGLLAFFVNYRFVDVLSSPSAFMLDVIATSALIIYITRVVLGYKQTWDRYQLLVNRTLYEKTLASGFGTVHFLVDASEQQEFLEAILAYAFLHQAENSKVGTRKKIADLCERFLFNKYKEKIEMPIDKAMNTLLRLGLVTEDVSFKDLESGETSTAHMIKVVPFTKSYKVLKEKWEELLH